MFVAFEATTTVSRLSDCHLLGHLRLARRRTRADASSRACLLLEDLPELQALISSYYQC